MRKNFLLAMAFAAVAVTSNAQDAYVGNKFFDNWYIGVKGGGVTPTTHSAFWKICVEQQAWSWVNRLLRF